MRICFLGESFVQGVGDPEGLGWVGRLCISAQRQGCDLTAYNLGIRGETSAQLRSRWQQEVLLRLPAGVDGRLVFCFGVNDTAYDRGHRRVALTDSLKNLRCMLQAAHQQFPVLLVGPACVLSLDHRARIAELSREMTLVCRELRVPYLDICAPLQQSQVWLMEAAAYDGAHPGAGGYAMLASLVEQWPAWQAWL